MLGIAVAACATWGFHRLRFGKAAMTLQAVPVGLVVAGACVLVSRLTSFQPGYLYGMVCGVVFARKLRRDEKGQVALAVATTTVAVAVLAWIGTAVLSDRAHAADPSLGVVVADNVLASVFIGGIVGTMLNLIPVRLLSGGAIRAWRVDAWGAAFGACLLLVVSVLLFHGSVSGSAPLFTTIALFLAFGLASIVARDWSLQRRRRAAGVTAPSLLQRMRDIATPVASLFEEAATSGPGSEDGHPRFAFEIAGAPAEAAASADEPGSGAPV